jgi:hypothetical protein
MAKVDLKALFNDPKLVPDDFKVTLPNGAEVTMHDLRLYDSMRGGELQADLVKAQEELKAGQAQLRQSSEQVAKMFVDLQAKEAALAAAPPAAGPASADPMAAYNNDQLFGPVMTRINGIETKFDTALKTLTDKLTQSVNAIGQMGQTYMGERAMATYKDIMARQEPEGIRPRDLSLDGLFKYTVDNRIYDRNNLPDLNAAYERMTQPARHAHELKQAEERGVAAERQRVQDQAMLPRPSIGGPKPPEGVEVARNLNDAINRAANDTDLWKQINSTPGSVQ